MRLTFYTASVVFAIVGSGCSSLGVFSGTFNSGHDATTAAISETSVRIAMFVEKNGHLPKTLKDLPTRVEHANRTTDAWNHPLVYKIDSENSITLKSLGSDGKPGGNDADADIIVRYELVGGAMIERHSTAER